MSLTLDCGTNPPNLRTKAFNDVVQIGEYDLSMSDFLALIEYVLTNTDLIVDDPRRTFLVSISKAVIEYSRGQESWSSGSCRIVIPERVIIPEQ